MNLPRDPRYSPILAKQVIPESAATRSQRINPWVPAEKPAATICRIAAGYEFKEAQIR